MLLLLWELVRAKRNMHHSSSRSVIAYIICRLVVSARKDAPCSTGNKELGRLLAKTVTPSDPGLSRPTTVDTYATTYRTHQAAYLPSTSMVACS